jgi:uncharacterized Ntn-hydrolase superfamily protein
MARIGLICLMMGLWFNTRAQDTFSILAYDSITREIGAAGASCLDLFNTTFPTNHFITEIFPDTGAIATQAQYEVGNQANARARMRAGDSPAQIMAWLNANDLGIKPQIRQYGAIRIGQPSAAFSGTQCIDYKGHRVGPNYTIHGNILLGKEILDSMEARFVNTKGDLACKLMAALQGAKKVGADTRCADNNSSSLFAFLKVSVPANTFGSFIFLVSLRTHHGDSIEPIDSLQRLFDFQHLPCIASNEGVDENTLKAISIFPNPAFGEVKVSGIGGKKLTIKVKDLAGREVFYGSFSGNLTLDVRGWTKGLYFFEVQDGNRRTVEKVIIQ